MEPVIKARGLTRHYGATTALDNIDLDIAPGRIVGLIGPNGAGKTTALKAILGLQSFEGSLEVLGKDPSRERDDLMKDVCFIADVAVLPKWIRVNQLLELVSDIHPHFSIDEARDVLSRTKIKPRAKVKHLSKGMIVQLHLAIVMAIDARLLVLDEPTLGLDILYRKQFYTHLLNEYFDEQRTILITTHQVEEVEHILTDLIFIRDGDIVLNSSMEDINARFVEVMVNAEKADTARNLKPLDERQVFGKHIFLFDGIERGQLDALGETRRPSIADLFVAIMQEDSHGVPQT